MSPAPICARLAAMTVPICARLAAMTVPEWPAGPKHVMLLLEGAVFKWCWQLLEL